ncbi:MAG TPA: hypothetical protein VGB17_02310 [Pyrinomonadaceae bacterium]
MKVPQAAAATTQARGARQASKPVQPRAVQGRRQPAAPQAYRPQPLPGVLQARLLAAPQPSKNSKAAPVAPPVYSPQPARKLLQPKMAGGKQQGHVVQTQRRPTAPPVYRPEPKKIVQPKMAASAPARKPAAAPPVYRPNPTQKVLQAKMAQTLAAVPGQREMTTQRGQTLPAHKPAPSAQQQQPAGQLKKPSGSPVAVERMGLLAVQRRGALQAKMANSIQAMMANRGAPGGRASGVIQRVTECGGAGEEKHIAFGNFFKSDAPLNFKSASVPIIIELLETDPASAKQKVEQLVATGLHTKIPVAFVFGLNMRIGTEHDDIKSYGKRVKTALDGLTKPCVDLTQYMESQGIAGGCFPLTWAPTSTQIGGYTFPFLECRSILTLHAGVRHVHEELSQFGNPVVRSMDADVSMDPLLTGQPSHPLSISAREMGRELSQGLQAVSEGSIALFSGGYEWDINGVTAQKLVALGVIQQHGVGLAGPLVDFIKSLIAIVNIEELQVRRGLVQIHHKSVYWPEPNVYMSLSLRREGANQSMMTAATLGSGEAQQKESTQYVQSNFAFSGQYGSAVSTRKPLKTYFDDFITYFARAFKGEINPSINEIENEIVQIRQTHLDLQKVVDILKWHNAADHQIVSMVEPLVRMRLHDCASAIHAVIAPSVTPISSTRTSYHDFIPTPDEMVNLMSVTSINNNINNNNNNNQ